MADAIENTDDAADQPDQPAPSPAQATTAIPPRPDMASMPSAGTVNVSAQPDQMMDLQGPVTPQETKAYLQNAGQAWNNDLVNQHITPKTYHDLYANKDTPGKIATIFSLMVGGMGSGLTGGPNAGLEMMNKVIANDLEAQKQSKSNAYNFLRLNQDHQMGEYNKKLIGANANYTNAMAQNTGFGVAMKQANSSALHIALTQTQKAVQEAAADPANQQKQMAAQNAQQALGQLASGMNNENANVEDLVAARAGLINAAHPNEATNAQSGGNLGLDENKLRYLKDLGNMAPGTPGALTPADASKATDAMAANKAVRQARKTWMGNFRELDQSILSGKLNPADYDTKTEAISDQLANQLNLGHDDKEKLKGVLFPKWNDWGTTREDKFKQGQEDFAIREAGLPLLDQYGLRKSLPFEPLRGNQQGQQGSSQPQYKTVNGVKYMKDPKTGKAVRAPE